MLFNFNYTTASLLHEKCSWLYLMLNSKFPVTDISTFTTLLSQHFSLLQTLLFLFFVQVFLMVTSRHSPRQLISSHNTAP